MRTDVAHLPHRSLRYLSSGEGRALLLLHAFPLSADQWLPQLARVPPGWRFVAPDLRGFRGAGPAFEDPGAADLSIDDYARDVAALATHLEIESATVCGVSMGGYVALAFRRLFPSRVHRLVLSNTRAGADTAEARAGRDRMIELVRREGVAAEAAAMTPRLLGETTRRDRPDLEDAVRRLILMNAPGSIAVALAALRDRPDSTALLPSIDVPSVVIVGDEDVITPPAEAELLHRGIAGSSLVVLPGVGHLSNLEDPLAWNSALQQFLK